jgi:hypothetical protein
MPAPNNPAISAKTAAIKGVFAYTTWVFIMSVDDSSIYFPLLLTNDDDVIKVSSRDRLCLYFSIAIYKITYFL